LRNSKTEWDLLSTLRELELQQVAPRLLEVLRRQGVASLSRFQVNAIDEGIVRGRSQILATHDYDEAYEIAEIALLNRVAKDYRARAIVLCPNAHQADVRFHSVSTRCARLGIEAADIIRRRDATQFSESGARVIVSTFTAFDIVSRLNPSILDNIVCVLVERLDLIGQPGIGARLETGLVTLIGSGPKQYFAICPPLDNITELQEWLDSQVITDPKEDLKRIFSVKAFENPEDSLADLTEFVHSKKGQTMILCASNLRCEELAQRLAGVDDDDESGLLDLNLAPEQRDELLDLAEEIREKHPQCHLTTDLAFAVAHGVAFVHEGVSSSQRRLISSAWKRGVLPVMTAPIHFALAGGFNATMAFLMGVFMEKRDGSPSDDEPLVMLNEWQMNDLIGSIGRRGKDAEAFAMVVVDNESEKARVVARYFDRDEDGNLRVRHGEVDSSMDALDNLQDLVLMQLCGSKGEDENPFSVIERTFWGSSKRITDVNRVVVDSSEEPIETFLARRSTRATYDRALNIPDDSVRMVSVRPDKIEGLVRSSSRELWHYTSLRAKEGVSCSCEAWKYQGIRRHRLCKHLLKFSMYALRDEGSKVYAEGIIRQALRGLEIFGELESDGLVIRRNGRVECTDLGHNVTLLGVPVRDARRVMRALEKERSDLRTLLRGIIHARTDLPKVIVTEVLKRIPAQTSEEVFCDEYMPGIVENCLEEIEYINSILLRLLESDHPLKRESEVLEKNLLKLLESTR